jgi:hypothetical protein
MTVHPDGGLLDVTFHRKRLLRAVALLNPRPNREAPDVREARGQLVGDPLEAVAHLGPS